MPDQSLRHNPVSESPLWRLKRRNPYSARAPTLTGLPGIHASTFLAPGRQSGLPIGGGQSLRHRAPFAAMSRHAARRSSRHAGENRCTMVCILSPDVVDGWRSSRSSPEGAGQNRTSTIEKSSSSSSEPFSARTCSSRRSGSETDGSAGWERKRTYSSKVHVLPSGFWISWTPSL